MKYIIQSWSKSDDGALYFIHRLEEMLFHYSDDIVRAPIHNSATLIIEYLRLERDANIQKFHLNEVAKELKESLSNDLILKEIIGGNRLQKLTDSMKINQTDCIHYLHGLIPIREYCAWCSQYIKTNIHFSNKKVEIRAGLRAWISSIIFLGYTPEYIYRYLKQSFQAEVENPIDAVVGFIDHFNLDNKNYRVYFQFMSALQGYKELLFHRLKVNFEDDGFFGKIEKKNNQTFIGYLDVELIDPYIAKNQAYRMLDIFISYYRVISNRRTRLLGKNAFVRNVDSGEEIYVPVMSAGYKAIEVEPQINLIETIDSIVIGCQNKPPKTYDAINKIITLHNMALRQDDLNDGFVNLWSTLEVISRDSDKISKIDAVIDSVLPILQNGFYGKYFTSIMKDIKDALSKEDYTEMMSQIAYEADDVHKTVYFVFLPEYESLREEIFKKLGGYPNIRNRIYKMYLLRENKDKVFKVSEDYATRLKWHLYRLYRVRNGIVHAGESDRYVQNLGEHLHIYCDGVIAELLTKLSGEESFLNINDVLLDTKLLISSKRENFNAANPMTKKDADYLLLRYFKEIDAISAEENIDENQ